jgi:hypothetical protein
MTPDTRDLLRQFAGAAFLLALIGLVFAVGHWIVEPWAQADIEATRAQAEVSARRQDPDVTACRDHGGIPIFSDWNGRLVDCKPLPRLPEVPR